MEKKIKLLIVEDNAGNKLLLQYGLEADFELDFASNGLSAINKFKQNKYDLILMDIHMPELDGIETTKQIRNLESIENRTPIFAVTSNMFKEQRLKCMEAGMDEYITKPVHTKALIERINSYLQASIAL